MLHTICGLSQTMHYLPKGLISLLPINPSMGLRPCTRPFIFPRIFVLSFNKGETISAFASICSLSPRIKWNITYPHDFSLPYYVLNSEKKNLSFANLPPHPWNRNTIRRFLRDGTDDRRSTKSPSNPWNSLVSMDDLTLSMDREHPRMGCIIYHLFSSYFLMLLLFSNW